MPKQPNDRREDSEQLLERFIALSDPKLNAKEVAQSLMKQYGSLAPLLEAQPKDLCLTPGVTNSLALLLNLTPQLTRYLERERASENIVLDNLREAGEYLKALYIGEHFEHFFALCLDLSGQLLDCVLIQQGTVDEAPFYLRHLLEATARSSARFVVLSHNHPSGTVGASPSDVESTLRAITALNPLGASVLDHVIVADGNVVSLRKQKTVPETLFLAQDPNNTLLRDWLK